MRKLDFKCSLSYIEHIEKLSWFTKTINGMKISKGNKREVVRHLDTIQFYSTKKHHLIHIARLLVWPSDEEIKECVKYFPHGIPHRGHRQVVRNTTLYGANYAKTAYNIANTNYIIGATKRNSNPETRSRFKVSKEISKKISNSLKLGYKTHKRRDWWDPGFWGDKGYKDPIRAADKAKERHRKNSIDGFIQSFKTKYGPDWEEKYIAHKREVAKCFNKNPRTYSSKAGNEVIGKLEEILNVKLTKEWFIRHKDSIVFYDAKYKKVLIEYDGFAWHCLPGHEHLYRGHLYGISCTTSKRKDRRKDLIAKRYGYTIVRINDSTDINKVAKEIIKYVD